MSREMTLGRRIRYCINAVKYWEKRSSDEKASCNICFLAKTIDGHLKNSGNTPYLVDKWEQEIKQVPVNVLKMAKEIVKKYCNNA